MMNSRQDYILQVLSSIAVGIMASCLTIPAVMLLGGILFSPWLESDVLFPPGLAILILVSLHAGVAVGIVAGTKYYRHWIKNRINNRSLLYGRAFRLPNGLKLMN